MNRVAVIGVIFLFVASSVIPISGFNLEQSSISTTSSNMLYVGGSGDGNYSTIKDAINNSNDGDTIYVYSNTYYECDIKVDKSITLVGEDKNTTIIDGDKTYKKHVLILEKDAISINGFTVQRCGHSRSGILVNSDNNIISNCNFFYNDPVSGIIISEQHNNVITNCYFENNHFGIDLYGWDDVARENVISNCIFRPNNDLKVDKTQNTVIDNCTFDDSGLRVKLDCNGLTVTDCQFYEKFGYIYIGSFGEDIRIENCYFANWYIDGIYVFYPQWNFTLRNCTFDNCNGNGIAFCSFVVGCIISNCKFINNTYNGIYFYGDIRKCNISDCIFINNSDGIEFNRRLRKVNVTRCHFEGNDIGIHMNYRNFFNKFSRNNFIDNKYFQVWRGYYCIMVNYYNENYWDDWRGFGPYWVMGFLNWDWHPAQEPYDIGV